MAFVVSVVGGDVDGCEGQLDGRLAWLYGLRPAVYLVCAEMQLTSLSAAVVGGAGTVPQNLNNGLFRFIGSLGIYNVNA